MRRSEFNDLRAKAVEDIFKINDTKGADYAGDEDALGNFKDAAAMLGITPEQVWAVYTHKHVSAIMSFCQKGQVESEPIEGRIHDVMVYCVLLLGLIEDRKRDEAPAHEQRIAAAGEAHHQSLYVSPGPTDPAGPTFDRGRAVGYIGSERHAAHPDHP